MSRNWKSAELRYTLRSRAMAGLSCTPREEVEILSSDDPESPSELFGLSGPRVGLGLVLESASVFPSPVAPSACAA